MFPPKFGSWLSFSSGGYFLKQTAKMGVNRANAQPVNRVMGMQIAVSNIMLNTSILQIKKH